MTGGPVTQLRPHYCCLVFAFLTALNAAAAEPPAPGEVVGVVTATPSGALAEAIVYLERIGGGSPAPAPAAPVAVSQKGARFEPALTIVCVGQAVVFLNDEERPVQHNVFSKSPAKPFDLGIYKPGVSKSVTFDKPGPVYLHCSIHRDMDGVVYVAPTPWFAHVAKDGAFKIAGVPAGEYELRTWQRRQRYTDASLRVTVRSGEITQAPLELRRN
jgi:plastocyanin